MKFSSALTLTTIVSIMSTVHGAPVSSPESLHSRRHSSVSELSGRQLSGGANFMENFGAAFEPENGIGKLLNFVKRQLGSTDSTSATHGAAESTGSGSSSSSGSGAKGSASNPEPNNAQTDSSASGPSGLMGGGLGSYQEAGFAFEPGQGIRAS